jgi:putative ABC transport system permease protein
MLKINFKTAWRNIFKSKTTALINIVGLSVGITSAVFILLWVQNEINFDADHPNVENIYRLKTSIKENNMIWESTPLLLADAAKKQVPEIEKVARLYPSSSPVVEINSILSYEKKAAYVDHEWFDIFQYNFLEGNLSSFVQNPYGVILTASAATKYFGHRKAVGETIRIDQINYQVGAIVEDAPSNSSFQYNVFIPLSSLLLDRQRKENDQNWSNFNYLTFIKLTPGSSTSSTTLKLTNILTANNGAGTVISLVSLKDMHFENDLLSSEFVHGNKTTVHLFSILAFLLLLIACINYVNLTTAKASLRAKEVSIRKMVGAKRIHLFYQFIAESILISFISLLTTLALIQLLLPSFNLVTGKNFVVPITSQNMWEVIGVTLLAALLLNSIYPALLLSSFKPLNVFRGFRVLKVKDSYFRKGLVVVQFAISVMLISSTIVIYRQMDFIQKTNPGYNRSKVLSFPLPPGIDSDKKELLIQSIKQELLTSSSIESVTAANQPIINIGSISSGGADWTGRDTTYKHIITQLSTDADFQKTMQLEMKEGRWFIKGNESDKNNVVLNETAVEQLNIPKPVIGQRFKFKGRTGLIIGVVKDFTYKSFHNKTGPLVAFNDPRWFSFFMVRPTPNNASKALVTTQNIWKKKLPGHPLEYNFLEDSFNHLYKEDQQASFLIFLFAIIAVVISSLGLFGLAAFTAEQRTKEIGIRKVLGASVTGIVKMISFDFLGLVFISILIASPIASYFIHRWLQNFAYRIDVNIWLFLLAGLAAILIALATVSYQSIKAAVANPVKSLRTE